MQDLVFPLQKDVKKSYIYMYTHIQNTHQRANQRGTKPLNISTICSLLPITALQTTGDTPAGGWAGKI